MRRVAESKTNLIQFFLEIYWIIKNHAHLKLVENFKFRKFGITFSNKNTAKIRREKPVFLKI